MSYEDDLRNPENRFSIPMQNIHVQELEKLKSSIPHVKIVISKELQTDAYALSPFYKPISRIIVPQDEK
ncbi:hypothetical protein BH11BAC2_BH11BAC2_25060 [soil metagenome]